MWDIIYLMFNRINHRPLMPLSAAVAAAHQKISPDALRAAASQRKNELRAVQQDAFHPPMSFSATWQSYLGQNALKIAAATQPKILLRTVDGLCGNLSSVNPNTRSAQARLFGLGVFGAAVRGASFGLLHGAERYVGDGKATNVLRATGRVSTVTACLVASSIGLAVKAAWVALAMAALLPGAALYAVWNSRSRKELYIDQPKISTAQLTQMQRDACVHSLKNKAPDMPKGVPGQFLLDFNRQNIVYRGFFDESFKPLGHDLRQATANLKELCSDDSLWMDNVAMLASQQTLNAVSALFLKGGSVTYSGQPVHLGLNSAGTVHALERDGFGLVRLHTWVPLTGGLQGAIIGGVTGPQPFIHPQPMCLQVVVDIPRPHDDAASTLQVTKLVLAPIS
jgi:hypothetical protein